MTYDGWSSIYDEFVDPAKCIDVKSGQTCTDSTKVNTKTSVHDKASVYHNKVYAEIMAITH